MVLKPLEMVWECSEMVWNSPESACEYLEMA